MGDWAAAYRERVHALAARLDGPDAPQQRDALRGELIALGKGLERDLAELTALKEEARELVEKRKTLKLTTETASEAERVRQFGGSVTLGPIDLPRYDSIVYAADPLGEPAG